MTLTIKCLHSFVWLHFPFYQGLDYFFYKLWSLHLQTSSNCYWFLLCFQCSHSNLYSPSDFWVILTLYESSFLLMLVQLLTLCHWHCVITSLDYFFNSTFPMKYHGQHWSPIAWHFWSGQQMQPSNLVLVLSCQYTGRERWLLHQNHSCTYCGNYCGQLVSPDALQQVSNFWS